MEYRKFTGKTLARLIADGMLEGGGYLLTEHHLIVPMDRADAVYGYLFGHGYASTSEMCGDYAAIEVFRPGADL